MFSQCLLAIHPRYSEGEISFLIAFRINAFNDAGPPLTMTNHIHRPIYNRISGEECLADKCHDNDRLGIGGRITSFHHPTPDYADRPILRERGGEERRLSVCLLIFLDK